MSGCRNSLAVRQNYKCVYESWWTPIPGSLSCRVTETRHLLLMLLQ